MGDLDEAHRSFKPRKTAAMKSCVIALVLAAVIISAASSYEDAEEMREDQAPATEMVQGGCQRRCRAGCSVSVFKHCNYGGYRINLTPGSYGMNALIRRGMRNDDLSSIQFHGSGCRAYLYEHAWFNGGVMTKTGNDHCFTNDRLRMLQLPAGQEKRKMSKDFKIVIVDENAGKNSEEIEDKDMELVQTKAAWGRRRRRRYVSWNDQISSIKVNGRNTHCWWDCRERDAKNRERAGKAAERSGKERTNKERTNKERNSKAERRAKVARERAIKAHHERTAKARERTAKERAHKERTSKERHAKERSHKERINKERANKERAAKERSAKERNNKERAAKHRERVNKERHAKERASKEKSRKEKAAKAKVERDLKAKRERKAKRDEKIAKEKAHKERSIKARIKKATEQHNKARSGHGAAAKECSGKHSAWKSKAKKLRAEFKKAKERSAKKKASDRKEIKAKAKKALGGLPRGKFKFSPNPCHGGKGKFSQHIKMNEKVVIGTIPAGQNNVEIYLKSPKDVDVELWDKKVGVIAWNGGRIDSAVLAKTDYKGAAVTYSGYNGVTRNGKMNLGHEFIKIKGKASVPLVMKAFGFAAGRAHVTYRWGADKVRCAAENERRKKAAEKKTKEKSKKYQEKINQIQGQKARKKCAGLVSRHHSHTKERHAKLQSAHKMKAKKKAKLMCVTHKRSSNHAGIVRVGVPHGFTLTGGGVNNRYRHWNARSGFEESYPDTHNTHRCDMGFGPGQLDCYSRSCKTNVGPLSCITRSRRFRGSGYRVETLPGGYSLTGCGLFNHYRGWNARAGFEEFRPHGNGCGGDMGFGWGDYTVYARGCKAPRGHKLNCRTVHTGRGNYHKANCPGGYVVTGCGIRNNYRGFNAKAGVEETGVPHGNGCLCDTGFGRGDNYCYAQCCKLN